MFPILNPPPSSLPIPSFWVVPVHQPQASNSQNNTVILYLHLHYHCFFVFIPLFSPHCSLYPIWLFPCGVISFNLNKLLSNSLSPSCMIANAFRVSFQMFYFSFILKNIYLGVEFKIGVSFF